MRFDVVTLFPEMINQACSHSILARAVENNVISVNTTNPRDYSENKHKKVDDTPYGGGAGMVLACQPMFDCYKSIQKMPRSKAILLTPQGKTYNHQLALELSGNEQLILICGHYEGFDERIRIGLCPDIVEISIGDFILTGGELGALCIIDSVTRLVEGGLGHAESSEYDSFADGLLEYSQYTKPREYEGMCVPEVLLNGNHAEINYWRRTQQILRTKQKRPDLYEEFLGKQLSKEDRKILDEI